MLECPECSTEMQQNQFQCPTCGYQFTETTPVPIKRTSFNNPTADLNSNSNTSWSQRTTSAQFGSSVGQSLHSNFGQPNLGHSNLGHSSPQGLQNSNQTRPTPPKKQPKIPRGVLIIREGDDMKTMHIIDGKTSIGREDDCTVVLQDERVSSLHAIIYVDEKSQRYIDISTNGSQVNGESCHYDKVDLKNGANIMVGDVLLVFMLIPPME